MPKVKTEVKAKGKAKKGGVKVKKATLKGKAVQVATCLVALLMVGCMFLMGCAQPGRSATAKASTITVNIGATEHMVFSNGVAVIPSIEINTAFVATETAGNETVTASADVPVQAAVGVGGGSGSTGGYGNSGTTSSQGGLAEKAVEKLLAKLNGKSTEKLTAEEAKVITECVNGNCEITQ